MFDKLIILDTGGYLIYNGNPVDSIEYFKKGKLNRQITTKVNVMYAVMLILNRYSILSRPKYLQRVVNLQKHEGFPPQTGVTFIKKRGKKEDKREPGGPIPEINFKTPNKLKQFIVFTKRDVLSKSC